MNMRVNSNFYAQNLNAKTNPNFKGEWATIPRQKYVNFYDGEIKIYNPDKNESPESIALAWQKETGELPIDWVKRHNTYNQTNQKVEYRIQGAPYMPIDVLKASVNYAHSSRGEDAGSLAERYTEYAKLEAQRGDTNKVSEYEEKIKESFNDIPSSKYQMGVAHSIDQYKSGLGSSLLSRAFYRY